MLSQHAIEEATKTEYFTGHRDVYCRLHYRGIHDTYIVFCNNREYFFKVYRCRLRTKNEIQTEINLLLILKDCDIKTIEPVAKKDGEYIIQFEVAEGYRYGVLYTAAGMKSAFSCG